MRTRLVVVLLGLLLALAMPSIAIGGAAFTLHPAGRAQAYASWKANVGEADSGGMGEQAIFMQTKTEAQAVVVIRGLTGQAVSSLEGLSWDMPLSPHPGSGCDAWPKWQMTVSTDPEPLIFGSCIAQVEGTAQEPAEWRQRVCVGTCIPTVPQDATINSLAIVFARPNDFVLLDNITVDQTGVAPHRWTSASDNATTALLNIGPSVALADAVSDVLGDLFNLFPNVPVTEWTLYPGVDLAPLPTVPTLP